MEIPGGTNESGESIDQTAGRELYEETGAINYSLARVFIFEVNGSFAMVYYTNITALSNLPDSEIGEVKFDVFQKRLIVLRVYRSTGNEF